MDKLKNNYLWLVAALMAVGGWFAYVSSQQGYITEVIKILDIQGQAHTTSTIKPSIGAWVYSTLSTFAFTLAISLFISLFVINRIENALSKEREEKLGDLQKAININVFDSLFKSLVPKEIFEVFKSDVISNKIVRKNANWLYDFRETGEGKEIELTQTIKYELHNVSHESVSDAIHATFDGHGLGSGVRRAVCMFEGEEIVSFNCKDIDREIPKEETVNTSDDGKVTITRSPDGYCNLAINVKIPPSKKLDVTVVYITIYDNYYVNDGYFTKYPMIDASLTATYPENYEFEIFQALSSELQRTLKEENRSIYEVKGGILPHQGFIYTLKRKNKNIEVVSDADVA